MKKLYSLLTLLLSICLLSCNKDKDNWREYSFLFYPRQVESTWSDNLRFVEEVKDKDGNMTYSIDENFSGSSCKAPNYMLGLYTCNLAYDTTQVKNYLTGYRGEYTNNWPTELTHGKPLRFFQTYEIQTLFVDESNIVMEQRLKDDYTKFMNKVSSSSSPWSSPPIAQEYRLTEIADLVITCNQTLFEQPAGSSLNEYFHMYDLNPGCIFAGNGQLKVTYEMCNSKRNSGLTIKEWLSYRPLAAAYFYFKLHAIPTELPANNVVFSFTLETGTGNKLTCTGKGITLTN